MCFNTTSQMRLHVGLGNETPATDRTQVRFLSGVSFNVVLVGGIVGELFAAVFALVRFFTGVDSQVRHQTVSRRTPSLTHRTREEFLARVRLLVTVQFRFARQSFAADVAN